MVKLDANLLRYLSGDDFRVLTAVEMGMKNHELVPGSLVTSIAGLRGGGTSKILHNLTREKLMVYERGKKYDGYRLTYLGYDYLALHVLSRREVVTRLGNQIGVGKESDVYVAVNDEEERFAIKLHRLGRTCFRKVNDKRDYHRANHKIHSWIYMSRLAAAREFSFLQALYERKFPVPKPIDCNRHCIVMELIDGTLLNHVAELESKETLYDSLMNLILSLANDYGVVHGDFNEFNIMIHNETLLPVLIDFPQMISTSHRMAREYFQRDVECIVNIFKKKYHYVSQEIPDFDKHVVISEDGKGIIHTLPKELDDFIPQLVEREDEDEEGNSSENDEEKESLDEPKSTKDETENKHDRELDDRVDEDDYSKAKISLLSSPGRTSNRESLSSTENDAQPDNISLAGSRVTYSVAGSTFTTDEIRTKLKREFANRSRREEMRRAAKGVKGEDCAVRRERRSNHLRIKEDVDIVKTDWYVE